MQGKKFELTKAQKKAIPALRSMGIFSVSDACKALKIPRPTIYEERNRWILQTIKAAISDSEDTLKSDALRVVSYNLKSEDPHNQLVAAKIALDRADRIKTTEDPDELSQDEIEGFLKFMSGRFTLEGLLNLALFVPLDELENFRKVFFIEFQNLKINSGGMEGLYENLNRIREGLNTEDGVEAVRAVLDAWQSIKSYKGNEREIRNRIAGLIDKNVQLRKSDESDKSNNNLYEDF